MKNFKNLIIIILCLGFFSANSQVQNDSIEIRGEKGAAAYQNDKALDIKQMLDITSANTEAYKYMKLAKSNLDGAKILGYIGGFMIGYTLGAAVMGGEPNWLVAGGGLGVILLAIPLSKSYNKNVRKAVGIYNSGLVKHETRKINCNFGTTSDGFGIRVSF